MKELREEAKKLGLNSFGKSADVVAAEIAQAKSETPSEAPKEVIRRDVNDIGMRGGVLDAEKRALEIESQRLRDGFDPLAPAYKLHTNGQLPGWHYRWVAATENAMMARVRLGYQVDESCQPVSAGDHSNGLKMIRMMKPEVTYKKDYAAAQQRIKDEEAALKRANIKGGLEQADGAYGDISIGQSKVTLGTK